jgi:hypothetical protein
MEEEMGMYTELYICTRVSGKAPPDVIKALQVMCDDGKALGDLPVIDHPFFTRQRVPWMLRSSSYYFVPDAIQHFKYDDIGKYWVLIVRCDLKNYEGEIEAFADWITPYLDLEEGEHVGHKRYEENELPTLWIHPNVWKAVT